ncbi:MAG: TIGR04282 family arsenosugar biosynthesis glycosyltransferase [Desulfobulbaceae bacterium]|nr:TIGR04282 family arsenosugar biosynthesis glycosyltransferase [Desulfobulbaceae bacterium]
MAERFEQSREWLLLFTRYPEPGQAKTRLIPALGAEGAAVLQRRMAETVIGRIAELCRERPVRFEIRYTGGDEQRVRNWLGSAGPGRLQGDGDLGARLERGFAAAFARGGERVVTVGSDCPDLSPAIIGQGFDALMDHDLVLGPSPDGGYYLIGLRSPQPALFADMEWGTDSVLPRTLSRARALGLSVARLETLVDVDRPEDLKYFRDHPHP